MKNKYKMIDPSEGIYCYKCGVKQTIIPNGEFDEHTGRLIAYLRCTNPNCKLNEKQRFWSKLLDGDGSFGM